MPFLAYSGLILAVSALDGERGSSGLSLMTRADPIRSSSRLTTSFNPNYFWKGGVYTYSHRQNLLSPLLLPNCDLGYQVPHPSLQFLCFKVGGWEDSSHCLSSFPGF